MAVTILLIGIVFFIAHALALVFERIALPDVLLLILLGVLAGPVLHLVTPGDFGVMGQVMTILTLVVILFEGGMALDVGSLRQSFSRVVPIFLATFGGTVIAAALAGVFALRLPVLSAVTFGCVLGSITPTVVLPLARTLKLSESIQGGLTLESSFTDVVSILLVFSLTEAAKGAGINVGRMIGSILSALVFAAVIGFAGSILWLRAIEFVRRFPNTVLLTFAFLFVVYGVAEFLGFSGPIAALAFGLGLANRPFGFLSKLGFQFHQAASAISENEKSFFGEVIFALKTFFFLYLGISIRVGDLTTALIGVGLTLVIYAIRLASCRYLGDRAIARRDMTFLSIMAPKGLASAAMAALPLAAGMAGGALIRDATYIIVFASTALTAILTFLHERTGVRGLYGAIFRPFGESKRESTAVT